MSSDSRDRSDDLPPLPRHARLSFAGPRARACRIFAALGLPITWRPPDAGAFTMPEPAPAVVHVEATAGSLLLMVLVDNRDKPTARALGDARLGPCDGDTAAVFTEILLTPALSEADVRRAVRTLVTALRRHRASAAA